MLDNLEDISVESSIIILTDFFKRVGAGIVIGLLMAIFFGWGSYKISFIDSLLKGYEFISYDSRMRARTAGVEQMSIEDVVIIDIDNTSVGPIEEGGLGRYHNWPHAYHGELINTVSSGNPKALLFDVIFDEENTYKYDLVRALSSASNNRSNDLSEATNQFLYSNDPGKFVSATANSNQTYHAIVFEEEDTLNFLPKMLSEPEGYEFANHIIHGVSDEAKIKLPQAERIGNTYVDLLSASTGNGSANFPQDNDGVIRRAPTAIYFDGADHVYPSLVMSAVIDILGIKKDGGFDYDFENNLLNLIDSTDTIVRTIPIDDNGRMYVNYFGKFQTFYYLPYSYCMDPEMLPPDYWEGKVALVGASLPGLMDLRNTPVQETFAGVEIHANVMHSILQNDFVVVKDNVSTFYSILILCIVIGILISFPKKPFYALPLPILGIVGWIIYANLQFINQLTMIEVVRPIMSIIGTFGGIFLYNYFGAEKDKRFLKK